MDNVYYMVVLGGPLTDKFTPGIWLKSRLDYTINYYNYLKKLGWNVIIIVTGGNTTKNPKAKTEAQVMKKYLVEHKISPFKIVMENKAQNTIQNVVYSKLLIDKIANNDFIVRILVITSEFHMERAKLLFEYEFHNNEIYHLKYISSKTNVPYKELCHLSNNEKQHIIYLKKQMASL
ncbi:MAG: YdcF family protein [Edafosvirus sp.]|uniref:YdcF family protein n=1 Tax=Edafosvirus sp. TaxID=2487765 RepID=A0A3G4ZZ27_9VIRU|nr:MAG: YdcF family protein [Edafosvirus sp.]